MDDSMEKTRSTDISPLLGEHEGPILSNDVKNKNSSRPSICTCAVLCILFMELCERLTFYGISGNLVLFASEPDHLNFSSATASILALVFTGHPFNKTEQSSTICVVFIIRIIIFCTGLCYFTPILGGWVADAKAGKFSTILVAGVIYFIGCALLPLGSITKDKGEHSDWAAKGFLINTDFIKVVYISGLFLVAIGTGGIKANVSPFGAEQVSNLGPAAIQEFFSWFYWFINIGALLSYTLVVYLQQNVSYFYGNLIPAISLLFALLIFLVGRRGYCIRPPTGSVLTTTLKIIWEAIKRSKRPSLSNSIVNHWLDRAKMSFGGSYSSWEVEDVKKVYRLLPIFASFILYWTVYGQMSTSMVFQGEYMNINIGSFQIPIASLSLLDTLGVLLLIPIMDKLVFPLLSRFNIRLSQLQRIGIGMLVAMASMLCAGGIELYRVDQGFMWQKRQEDNNATQVSNATIFFQVPQYFLVGLSEVFTSITGLELAYTEAPRSLQGVIMGVFLMSTGLGTLVGAALVAIVNAITGIHGKQNRWFPEKKYVNEGKLAYYFFTLAVLMFLNFIVYVFVAMSYKAKKESAAKALARSGKMSQKEVDLPPDSRKNEDVDDCWTSKSRRTRNGQISS